MYIGMIIAIMIRVHVRTIPFVVYKHVLIVFLY